MVTYTGADNPPFRLSMLIYDRRYRSLTLQAIVFILVMLAASWLIDNTLRNLSAMGKTLSFDFLFRRAGYDIPQQLIPYNSDDTHLRATVIGLLNTLLVSILGCIAATILGVIVGVLRLSSNWLIARLMTVYVEVFRNIPLLLWILVCLAIFTEVMPPPNAYRGENPAANMILFDMIAPTNRYTAIPSIGMTNPPGTISLGREGISWAFIAFAVVIAAAWTGWRVLRNWAQRVQDRTGKRPRTWWISLAMFVVPVLFLTWYFGLHLVPPVLRGFNFADGINLDNAFVVLWLALTLYTGAFIAEIVRAGILAVSRGQTEAAFALGLRPRRTMSLVVLPQALRVIVPPLISQYLNLTKNSSLAIAVGYMDLRGTLGGTTLNQTGREMEAMVLMMGIYLALSLIISAGMNIFNSRVKLKER
ncbi:MULTISPECIES: amino acid ABC transporter permease [Paracoccus]|jgi:general L-amino acid transport system permease protein|uniref:L-asparagine ABC transporter membrane protein / L-glutamine ABC transporter membrane protein / L-glutamate ABC transporter membrane protein / L-aspartate ABC transporter membrane protein n=1 Tax=Paracoccus denitrificans (strain Pd 1222) TaxID=318586 RepID=A1B062_PARDP|nr:MULTISPECIES: ABC transporter permease subunit [Paracoccus]ABL68906.1 L-asparagine ABC transporter membrane protein / L-glutamine ABC transporter membrane protein / L-glutamate ABC transporter membrane protein / L-aspartate ABC transporter membrane protein [Paracoccus denitrificans PD1222]MBB4625368.1 general L-amino acid transport system permease protein [Paracoccus denitrificans]MCU7428194.1 ABC transporter permease subunit [Paracoccus denitrificans]MDK8873450.1 ABC transporter permease su